MLFHYKWLNLFLQESCAATFLRRKEGLAVNDWTDTVAPPLLCSPSFALSWAQHCLVKREQKVSERELLLVPFCRLFRWSIPLSSLASPGMGGISDPVSWRKQFLLHPKMKQKNKRGLNSYAAAAALSSWLLPFCSSQAAVSVAAAMTRNCY